MKTIFKQLASTAYIVAVVAGLASCTSEAPFSSDGEGEVRMNVTVNSKVTRALNDETTSQLASSCRVYISNSKGVLHKWIGLDNLPKSVFLRYGEYLAEAFAGDSVTASFDKVYYKGQQSFSVGAEQGTTQVSVTCKIANVVTSIDVESIQPEQMHDVVIRFRNSRGELEFTEENMVEKGYFMMPQGDSTIKYTITGKNYKDIEFESTDVIENVEPGHEYRMKFNYHQTDGSYGGGIFSIEIEDVHLVEETVEIYGGPAFSWVNNIPLLDEQVVGTPGTFESRCLRVAYFKGLSSLRMTTSDDAIKAALGGRSDIEFDDLSETTQAALSKNGLKVSIQEYSNELYKHFFEFTGDFLNNLPVSKTEYTIHFYVKDKGGKVGEYDVRIANSDEAIIYASPVRLDPTLLDSDKNPMAILSRSATIPIVFTKDDVQNPALQYREEGVASWSVANVSVTRATSGSAVLEGLKPSTTYECRAVAGNVTNGTYEFTSDIITITTESEFSIPNWSMEDWSKYGSSIDFPGSGTERTFWDSGNEGANKASDVLTTESTDMAHSGSKSARLESKFCSVFGIGKFAAGNLFTGTYKKTDGTDGVLEFGRPYDGSHPSKLSVWVNYKPAAITDRKTDSLRDKELDLGQIYVALSTEPIEIRTKASNRKLFNKDDACILAYGEYTFESAFEENGGLKHLEIPLEYYEKANTIKPNYLIIVCSASKFGDYFEGGRGSLMYVDDFELVYE